MRNLLQPAGAWISKAADKSQGFISSVGSLSLENKDENSKIAAPTAAGLAPVPPSPAECNGNAATTHTIVKSRTKTSDRSSSEAVDAASQPVTSADKLHAFGDLHAEAAGVCPPAPSPKRPGLQPLHVHAR